MGVPTIAESQLQRPSGSGVASATGYRTQVRPAKTPRHPPIVLSTPWRARVSCGVGAKNPSRRPGAAGAGGPIQSIMDELDRSSAARSPRGHDDAVKVVVRVRPLLALLACGRKAPSAVMWTIACPPSSTLIYYKYTTRPGFTSH